MAEIEIAKETYELVRPDKPRFKYRFDIYDCPMPKGVFRRADIYRVWEKVTGDKEMIIYQKIHLPHARRRWRHYVHQGWHLKVDKP